MSRIARPIPTAPRRLNWKLALPVIGLVACAAFYARAETVEPGAAATGHQRGGAHFNIGHGDRDNAWALVRETDHGTNMSGDSADWKDVDAARHSIKGKFLWFRQGGKAYVVQDPDLLAKAEAAWAPVDRLGEQMDGYGKQMDEHGKKMEALGKEMAHASMQFQPNESKMRDFERKMERLGDQMEKLGERMDGANDAERERLQGQMNQLGEQMNATGRQMAQQGAAPGNMHGAMEEAGRRMREASKPMDALGKQMAALGKQMEHESHEADKTVRALIRDAMARGLAHPAPVNG